VATLVVGDHATLALIVGDQHAAVVLARAVVIGLVGLHPVQVDEQQRKQREHDDADPAQGGVHD